VGLELKIVLQNDGYFVNIILLYMHDVQRDYFTRILGISLCFMRPGNVQCTFH